MDDRKLLDHLLAELNKGEATATTLASLTGLAETKVVQLLAKLQADNRVIKFADRDEWFLLLDFT